MSASTKTGDSTSKRSWLRATLGTTFAVGLCLVLLELGAYAALQVLYDGSSPSDVRQRRASVLVVPLQPARIPVGLEGESTAAHADDDQDSPHWIANEVLHPYLGYVRRPKPELYYPVSAYGFEDPNLPIYKRQPGRTIVGVIGGSFAMYLTQASRERLRSKLQESPRLRDTELIFVNAALGGYKQPQQVMTLNYLLAAGAEFDIVINIDGFNEIALHPDGNRRQGVSVLYPRSWYFRVENLPDKRLRFLEGRAAFLAETRIRVAERFSTPVVAQSSLCNLVWKIADENLDRTIRQGLVAIRQYEPDDARTVVKGPADRFGTEIEAYEEMAEIWERGSVQLNALCDGLGIEYFHFLQPNQYDLGAKELTAEERRLAYSESSRFRPHVERAYPLLRSHGTALAEAGVRFYDTSRVFANVEETVFWDACCHLNVAGYDLFADQIGSVIVSELGE